MNLTDAFDSVDVSCLLRKACDAAGSQKAFAWKIGVTPAFVHRVLNANAAPSQVILDALGLKKVTRYVPVSKSTDGVNQ